MTRAVTATEAKNRLGALMQDVRSSVVPVLFELHGRPGVALITAEQLEDFETLKRKRRSEEAIARLEAIRVKAGDRNADLSEEEAMDLAVQVVREVRREMREAGQLRFEQ